MTAVDWEEVKRLAADFQRAQLTSTSQTLSERNCIEIINKLIELNLLDVIFTSDGKEYITPQYLVKEIKDELYVNGGRINLVELSHTLNVDLSHVSGRAAEVERSTPGCTIIMGQLIDRHYITTIAQEINEKLQSLGQITISELTRTYDLPSDFLQSVVEKNLGKLIFGTQDKSDARVFFTEAFVEHNRCVVRGALCALTRPTQLSILLQVTGLDERDFFLAFDSLVEEKEICGNMTARNRGNATYIPYVYTKHQTEWVDNFYKQNGYLEYDALTRLGITEPVSFVKRHFQGEGLVELASCAVGPQLMSQVQNGVEEILISGSYLDLALMLPSVLGTEDVTKVLDIVLKRCKSKVTVQTLCQTVLVTNKFLDDLVKPFHTTGMIKQRAEDAVSSGAYVQAQVEKRLSKTVSTGEESSKLEKREERRKKAAGGKGGGGTQGRETKTKSLKKKTDRRTRGDQDESEEEYEVKKKTGEGKLEFFTLEDVESVLSKQPALSEEDGELITAIAEQVLPRLNKVGVEAAREAFERNLANSAGSRRKVHSELQDKVDSKLTEIRLYERGLRTIGGGGDQHLKLTAHLVKTVCSDVVNFVFAYVSQEMCSSRSLPPGPETRAKILTEVPQEVREPLLRLHKALAGTSLEEFFSALEPALSVVDIVLRKPDKKKEKVVMQSQREALLKRLMDVEEPSEALLVAILLLLQSVHHNTCLLHASGRFVPFLLDLLQPHLPHDHFTFLHNYQESVLKLLTVGDDADLETELRKQLSQDLSQVRDIVLNFKKSSQEKA